MQHMQRNERTVHALQYNHKTEIRNACTCIIIAHADPIQHLSVESDADADLVKIRGLTWMKYLGIRTSLVTMHAPWVSHTTAVGQTESTEFTTSQSPGTKHYVPIHIPACRTSIKQNKYL